MKDNEAVREALAQAGILKTEDCGCCIASDAYMARKARDVIESLRRDIDKLKNPLPKESRWVD